MDSNGCNWDVLSDDSMFRVGIRLASGNSPIVIPKQRDTVTQCTESGTPLLGNSEDIKNPNCEII